MEIKVNKKQNNSKNCLVCGMSNELGLKARFYELETNELVAKCTLQDIHQSYPERGHGGITAALLDETIGRASLISDSNVWGVTVELTIRYKKPIPLNEEITVVGRITNDTKRLFEGTGEIILKNGDIAATAHGKYMKMPLDKISTDNFTHNEWFLLKEDHDPAYIEFVEQ